MTAGNGCTSSRRNGRTISLHVRQKEFQDGIPETGDSWSHAGEPWIWRLPPISENMAVCHISPGVRTVLLWICIIFWKKNISADQGNGSILQKKYGHFKIKKRVLTEICGQDTSEPLNENSAWRNTCCRTIYYEEPNYLLYWQKKRESYKQKWMRVQVRLNWRMAARPGFEPRQTEPESVVLPLHHRAKQGLI